MTPAVPGLALALLLTSATGYAEESEIETAYETCVAATLKTLTDAGKGKSKEDLAKSAEISCGLIRVNCAKDRQGEACRSLLADYAKAPETATGSTASAGDGQKGEFAYTFARNPYKSYLEEQAEHLQEEARRRAELEKQASTQVQRVREPLEQFELDGLKLTATIARTGSFYALIQDPRKRGHIVREGNYIGTREGRVEEISFGKLVIVEPVIDVKEPGKTISITLELPREPETEDKISLSGSGAAVVEGTDGGALPEGLLPPERTTPAAQDAPAPAATPAPQGNP